jgi:hypothetical protein
MKSKTEKERISNAINALLIHVYFLSYSNNSDYSTDLERKECKKGTISDGRFKSNNGRVV